MKSVQKAGGERARQAQGENAPKLKAELAIWRAGGKPKAAPVVLDQAGLTRRLSPGTSAKADREKCEEIQADRDARLPSKQRRRPYGRHGIRRPSPRPSIVRRPKEFYKDEEGRMRQRSPCCSGLCGMRVPPSAPSYVPDGPKRTKRRRLSCPRTSAA